MTLLRIVSPCDESWDAMRGSGRVRHCDACDKEVHDLTHASEREASGFVRLHAGGASICARVLVVGAAVAACGSPPRPAPLPAEQKADATDAGMAMSAPPRAIADSDGDGIADDVDACVGSAGAASDDPKRNGCPNVTVTVSGGVQVLKQIHFAKTKTAVTADGMDVVAEVVAALKSWPQITKVEIGGHASLDEHGAQALSEKRAAAVMAKIVAEGVDPKRLVAKGYAAAAPIEGAATEDARAKNRRVEFRILEEGETACAIDAGAP